MKTRNHRKDNKQERRIWEEKELLLFFANKKKF